MSIQVRLVFMNDIGVACCEDPVLVEVMPFQGAIMSGPPTTDLPDSEVISILLEQPPDEMLSLFGMPFTAPDYCYDGLPIVVCELPDGWRPDREQMIPHSQHLH